MAECPKCGAITTYGLELAWRLRTVTCSECSLSMRLGDRDLRGLRDQLFGGPVVELGTLAQVFVPHGFEPFTRPS